MQALVARQRFANNSTATPSTPVRKVDEKVAARNSRRASRARVLEHASRRITQRWAVLAADQVVHEKDEQEGSVDQKEEQQPQNRASLTAAQSAHWSLCLRLGLMGGSHYRRMGALPPPAYLDSDSDSEQEAEGEQEEGSHEESDGRREGAQARRARHARHRAMADLATMAAIESEEEREEEEKKEQKYAQASAESHPPLFAPVAVRSTGASPLSGHTPSGSVSSTNSSNSYSSGHESLFDAQEERHSVAGGRSRATTMSTHGGCVERTSKIDLELAKLDKELLETFDAFGESCRRLPK